MKRIAVWGVGVLIYFIGVTIVAPVVFAVESANSQQNSVGVNDEYDDLKLKENKKTELEQKLAEAKQQEKTLANQIGYLENQISLTMLQQDETLSQIEETQKQLTDVNGGIDQVQEKLGNLGGAIDDLYGVLTARVRASYQMQTTGTGAAFLVQTESVQSVILQQAYLRALQKEDNRLLTKMKGTQEVYEVQKTQLENLKVEKETLKSQLEYQHQLLEKQKNSLADQQAAKSWVLGVTKSQEQQYQVLLAQIDEEIRAIKAALSSLGTKIGAVKQGDVIGHLGNTGCSTGAHVHFGHYVNGVAIDPQPKLSVGSFIWPVKSPIVTQGFGDNLAWYQANFGVNGHNGIDMVDGAVGYGAPVLAVADGVAYQVSDSQACWLTGTVGKGVRVDHPDGTKTIYWHLQ